LKGKSGRVVKPVTEALQGVTILHGIITKFGRRRKGIFKL